MNIYRDVSTVILDLPFVDENGQAVTPTSASYRVLSEDNSELVPSTAIVLSGAEVRTQVTIGTVENTLATDQRRALRVVELTLISPTGTVSSSVRYIIESDAIVISGSTSFQTFNEALLSSMDMLNIERWNISTYRDQKTALIEAYINICRLQFSGIEVNKMRKVVYVSSRTDVSGIGGMRELTAEDLQDLDPTFLSDLRKAQVAEANFILGGDSIEDKRRIGLLSETIGESSNMFRSGTPLALPVSDRAMDYLKRYVVRSLRLSRS